MKEKLLTREEFRKQVFERDKYCCVICKTPGNDSTLDPHHILDRKLFDDNGYYLSNGASLCEECHIKAERCELSVEEIREAAGIKNIILPSNLKVGVIYDKWGNAEAFNAKYPRSLHAQISLGTTSDDRFMPNGYVNVFRNFPLIITEKLDGQNDSINKLGVFARSHSAPTQHAWDKYLHDIWNSIKNDLGDIELFGESMYAIHSIAYKKLENYFYLFGVRENGIWKSWEEVKWWASAFDFPTVPEIPIEISLNSVIASLGVNKERGGLQKWLAMNLGMTWEEYVETEGQLGGYDPITGFSCCEGFVVRHAGEFKVNEGHLPVDANEFDSLFKLVRKKHVKTDEHWTKNWKRAKLKWENENG
jgi:hypothetical protein